MAESTATVAGAERIGDAFASAREQGVTARAAAVVHAVVAETRVVVGVEVELLARERLEADVHEEDVPGGVGRVGLRHAETAGLLVHLLVGQAARVEQPDAAIRGVAVLLGERPAVGDDEVERAHAGRAEVGIEDLGQAAVVERVPHLARGPRGRAVAILVRLGPERLGARAAGRRLSRRRHRQGEQQEQGDRDGGDFHRSLVPGASLMELSSIACHGDLRCAYSSSRMT